jgi:glycosyltransferase involved in cell wall biosynthesis
MTQLLFATYAYPPLFYPRALQISMLARILCRDHDLKIIAADFGRKNEALMPLVAPCPVVRIEETKLAQAVRTAKGDRIKRFLIPDEMVFNFPAFREEMDKQNWDDMHLVTFGQPMAMHLLGLIYKKRFPHIRWTAHFSDPWNHEGYSTSTGLAKILNHKWESDVYKMADRLIFTSPETIESVFSGRYAAYKHKARYVPHGFDPALYKQPQSNEDKIRIGYFGTFYGERQPHSLFKALRQMPPDILQGVEICFYGAGDGKIYNAETKGLEQHLQFSSGVDFLKSLEIASGMDGLLVIDAPAETSVFFPSKLADYIGANRPIFGITPPRGASARILCSLRMSVANPDNPEEIAKNLSQFIEGIKAKSLYLDAEERESYSSENVAKEFMAALA